MKTIRLTSPYTKSEEVVQIQKRLGLRTDGQYGPVTAGAVKNWKWYFGYHKKYVTQDYTASDHAYLFGEKPKTALMKVRASRRAKARAAAGGNADRAVSIFRAWAADGLVEQPANSNIVPRLVTIGRHAGVKDEYANMGYFWCAYSALLASLQAGSMAAHAGLVEGKFNPLYVPEIDSLAGAGKFGLRHVGWKEARPGDWVIFNWDGGVPDHIGMLISVLDSQTAETVEGNTSSGNGGSQSNGGGVYIRRRDRSTIQSIIRWS